jgi:hypothetical protein
MTKFKRVVVRAYTKDGYHKDILVQDEHQIRMTEDRVQNGVAGQAIYPADFPEMVRFEVIVEVDCK